MNSDDVTGHAQSLVEGARSDSVTVDRLTDSEDKLSSGGETTNEPIIYYLFEEEQPHFILKLNLDSGKFSLGSSVTVSGPDGTSELKPRGRNRTGWFVITDMRALILINGPDDDDVISIPQSSIDQVDYDNKAGLIGSSHGADVVLSTKSYTYEFATSDDIRGPPVDYIEQEDGGNQSELEEVHYLSDKESVFMCKECKQEVSPDAKKCPHCGYYPGKGGKGALWHLSSVFVWPMAVKGTVDEIRSRRGVAEESTKTQEPEDADPSDDEPLDKIERLSELNEKGVISDEEFETKKAELLDEI